MLGLFELEKTPPYLAISHAWSDHIFPKQLPIDSSYGGKSIHKTMKSRFPSLLYCWIDNFCIKQGDDADKAAQIPLMGSIYGKAVAVLIVLSCEIGFEQSDVDLATASMIPAMEMWIKETYFEEHNTQYWRYGSGRGRLVEAMRGLSRLTRSTWATRIWTLQEYVLAKQVVWIGKDLHPITIDDKFFQAIPGLCDQLQITECLSREPGSEFEVLFSYFSGMANSRLGDIEQTRIMELLGNRKATVAVDEVYGIMAASGVEILPRRKETKEEAWQRWCEAAVTAGRIRWAMLPKPAKSFTNSCVIPAFNLRHELSSRSMLDHVEPFGAASMKNGTITLIGRRIGSCRLLRRLGSLHRSENGYHRDITLILFSNGRWSIALQLAQAFSASTYDGRRLKAIAQVMTTNYNKARQFVQHGREEMFTPFYATSLQFKAWSDLMLLLSQSIMDPMNGSIAYLARISRAIMGFSISILAIIVLDDRAPVGPLEAIDFNAITGQQQRILMVVEKPQSTTLITAVSLVVSLHKAGTTLPVSGAYDTALDMLSFESFDIGGTRCAVCEDIKARPSISSRSPASNVGTTPPQYLRRRDVFALKYLMYFTIPLASQRKRFVFREILKRRKWRHLISMLSSIT